MAPTERTAIVVIVGDWKAVSRRRHILQAGSMQIQRCPAADRPLRELVARQHPAWLLIGDGPEEAAVRTLVRSAFAAFPGLRLAMLGPFDDWRRCERWMRRGCTVYLSNSSPVDRGLAALRMSSAHGVIVIDRIFQDAGLAEAHRAEPPSTLTGREDQVLRLMCRGLRNADIASALGIKEHTVELHVQHILSKLGVRSRVGAVLASFHNWT